MERKGGRDHPHVRQESIRAGYFQSDLARSDPNIGDDQIGLVWGVSK